MVRADSWFHATNRVGDTTALLSKTTGAQAFVDALGKAAEEFAVEIHSYCAMGSHYHVLARADEDDLTGALRAIDSRVISNPRRPRLCRMRFGRHLINVTRYIHLNPVAAQLVLSPEDWPWSSYRGYIDRMEAPDWLRSDAVLGWFGSIGPRFRYREMIEKSTYNRPFEEEWTYLCHHGMFRTYANDGAAGRSTPSQREGARGQDGPDPDGAAGGRPARPPGD